MVKEVKRFQCGKCESLHNSKEEAEHCENFHARKQNLYIKDIEFDKNHFAKNMEFKKHYPSHLIIKSSSNSRFLAEYILKTLKRSGKDRIKKKKYKIRKKPNINKGTSKLDSHSEKIIQMLALGRTKPEIAVEVGTTTGNLYRWMKENNIPYKVKERNLAMDKFTKKK